ncbi:hypothetical protein [Pseudomonas sp. Leaf58]|uniref:hypothetical protein n=1 Tax=unclassified Pseudomonas TaxID=196821 RepID=UPI000702391D|nr:hypothetical protein [Pseudomonas sp. Leaf58]KQN61956.1 hypothetical protein ASF02_07145 [Pseudomonas sp. Leaf58]
MAREKSKHRKAAAATELVYGFPGNLLSKWEAELIDENQGLYKVHRKNGSTRMVKLDQSIETLNGSTIVSKNPNGTLIVGEHSVLIGRNLKHGFQARAMGRGSVTFLLKSDDDKTLGKVTVGQSFNGVPVTLIAPHLLKVGEDIYPVTPKLQETKLLVYKTPLENGYLSYINVIEPDNPRNGDDGTPGTFVPPASPQDPGMFYEEFAGQKVLTGQFWLEKGDQRLTFHGRDGATALEEIRVKKTMQAALEMAVSVGIDPMEYHEYKEAHDQLKVLQERWIKKSMYVLDGAEIFKPHDMRAVIQSGMGF